MKTIQLMTFFVDGALFGIDVMKIQEVTDSPKIVRVPLAPSFVCGLVNLRGQIATALGLHVLFSRSSMNALDGTQMSIVCDLAGSLVSLLVDTIGDVIEVEESQFEVTPDTVSEEVRQYIKGIFKLSGQLLSVLDLEALANQLSAQGKLSGGGKQ